MGQIEDIATIPAGTLFLDLWQRVDADTDAVNALARTLKAAGGSLGSIVASARSRTRRAASDDPGLAALVDDLRTLDEAGNAVAAALASLADAVRKAGTALETARQELRRIADRVQTRLKAAEADSPVMAPLLGLAHVLEGVAQAEPIVATATGVVQDAVAVARSLDIAHFAAVAVPSVRTYQPAEGNRPTPPRAATRAAATAGSPA